MPHGEILTLHTSDAPLAHSLRLAHMRLHKPAILLQQDAHAHQKHSHTNNYDTINEYFHHFILYCTHLFVPLPSKTSAKIGGKNIATTSAPRFLTLFSKKASLHGQNPHIYGALRTTQPPTRPLSPPPHHHLQWM